MIEVVGYRRGHIFRREVSSVELGIKSISWAVDDGTWAGVGVFVDGEPYAVDCYDTSNDEAVWRKPNEIEERQMRDDYAKSVSEDDDECG